jgi:IclR family transcriptional regulator, pca regulon regulatory protein
MPSDIEEPLFIKSIEKGFIVLELFKTASSPLRLSQISTLTGFSLSATQRLLFTLEKLGYLNKNLMTKRYTPGLKALSIGFSYDRLGMIKTVSTPTLEKLSENLKEDIYLLGFDGSNIINIINIPREKTHVIPMRPGAPFNIAYSAGGRSVLSYLPGMDAVGLIFASPRNTQTTKTLTDPKLIIGKVEEAYSKGFSVVDGEHALDIMSIGSAILDKAGAPIAAIELVAPRKNLKWMKQRERIGTQLETAAREITESLSHQ